MPSRVGRALTQNNHHHYHYEYYRHSCPRHHFFYILVIIFILIFEIRCTYYSNLLSYFYLTVSQILISAQSKLGSTTPWLRWKLPFYRNSQNLWTAASSWGHSLIFSPVSVTSDDGSTQICLQNQRAIVQNGQVAVAYLATISRGRCSTIYNIRPPYL